MSKYSIAIVENKKKNDIKKYVDIYILKLRDTAHFTIVRHYPRYEPHSIYFDEAYEYAQATVVELENADRERWKRNDNK